MTSIRSRVHSALHGISSSGYLAVSWVWMAGGGWMGWAGSLLPILCAGGLISERGSSRGENCT